MLSPALDLFDQSPVRKPYLIVCILGDAVVCYITHTFNLRDTRHQGFLDAFFQSVIGLTAALATTTKFQNQHTVIDINQTDLTTMAGQPWVDLGLQILVNALRQRTVFADHCHFGVWRFNR